MHEIPSILRVRKTLQAVLSCLLLVTSLVVILLIILVQ